MRILPQCSLVCTGNLGREERSGNVSKKDGLSTQVSAEFYGFIAMTGVDGSHPDGSWQNGGNVRSGDLHRLQRVHLDLHGRLHLAGWLRELGRAGDGDAGYRKATSKRETTGKHQPLSSRTLDLRSAPDAKFGGGGGGLVDGWIPRRPAPLG